MSIFDPDELLHLGLHALQNGWIDAAVGHLKECLELEADHPGATYLLAAAYAQIGLYERAKPLFRRAVELAPAEHTAVFQLGLLELTGGDSIAADATWQRLDALGAAHYLHNFKSALLALAAGDSGAAAALIEEGLRNNTDNAALNADMLKIREAMAAPATAAEPAHGGLDHFVLSSYQNQR